VTVALTLLRDVRWRGRVVAGDRSRALLAALAASNGRAVSDGRLIDLVWGHDPPANEAKSLQVLVSRTRAACGADAIVRDGAGYRLGIDPGEVDSVRLAALARTARAELERDAASAQRHAREALALADGLAPPAGGDGALGDIRLAAAEHAAAAAAVLAQAASRLGAHAEALPGLETAHAAWPEDESVLADLLRAEAGVRGPGLALERFERYRRDLRERLGTSPGARLGQVQRELLALDDPVRQGVQHDATKLVGRDDDIAALRGLLASSRVVSIVGPGGLGKTRLAHVLARAAAQPHVHVVELVGVTAAEDVVAEVGSALGVRDSVSSRQALTPEQRADVRGRIAQRVAQAPSLLVLDNCEHLIDAVARLVAFLVAETADLRVLTTSRAPLAIAAERVYPLGELGVDDAARLFRERALAARPGVQLDEALVRGIVARLDGLPLAIELAAAKVRAMAVDEIDRRLEDRFALLRGGDRSAPDRHQTLLAVIDWSWNLLDAVERRALRRLALFNDGFTLEAADAMVGGSALEAVQGLVDQSLLSVHEGGAGLRYRMLETVREFGRMQLVTAGEADDARMARRAWAVAYARRHRHGLVAQEQFTAIDAVAAEEINLADELRETLADGDRGGLVELLGTLGMFWTARGEHARLLVPLAAIAHAVDGWSPPPELEDAARAGAAIALTNALMTVDDRSGPLRDLLERLGPGTRDARLAAMVRVLLEYDPGDAGTFDARLERLTEGSDPHAAQAAWAWLSHVRENSGDPVGAVAAAEHAFVLNRPEYGPWSAAMLHNQLGALQMHLGDRASAVAHLHAALPVMERLGAKDDVVQLRSGLALCAIADGRLGDAEAELQRIAAIDDGDVFGGIAVRYIGAAELALARGDRAGGLAAYRDCAAAMRDLRFPGIPATGLEPWVVFGESTALVAHAHHAEGPDAEEGRALFRASFERTRRLLESGDPRTDFPVAGIALFGLATWSLLRAGAAADDALRLLALADRFAYNRAVPTMAWERIAPVAEERAPGRLAALRDGYGDRRPRDLLDEARRLVER
jgi:predicted ATPase/DNA-binding SARP family transcriptional activator